ncbi:MULTISPECIES: FecR family protein [unclassified Sphingobacterium]|uniref:FecR family protein n=1 Tax=unclassified Sphingobacterium TaxID=2609468 RepID=UPI00104BC14B|nr:MULTISPECIES: FecR family protein [unclassified Sphingobacterium]MCS3554238.1 hypothetical protein [Sphingobacterium sp. JUb21]TCR08071.1 FecR family protein [Sphingobacterium sp. JUb20]
MSKTEDYKQLIRLYYSQRCSGEDIALIRTLIDNPLFQSAWEEVWLEDGLEDNNRVQDLIARKMYANIIRDERLQFQSSIVTVQTSRRIILYKKLSIAASLFVGVIVALLYWKLADNNLSDNIKVVQESSNSRIVPGQERATIILDDGRKIDLDKIVGDTVIDLGSFSIVKSKEGHISYRLKSSLQQANKLAHNTIVTPRGGEYQLLLPDGTQVWLNASTTLRYPIVFSADKRAVELDGEAYFNVAKHQVSGKHVPFIVNTGEQRLEVLGTQFNINSYQAKVVTTLVEGKVKLEYPSMDMESRILLPNDQSTFDPQKQQFEQHQVDPLYIIAWKEGNFSFDNASLSTVMEDICRWYNVDVQYHGNFDHVHFSGTISRYSDIDKLLQTIALTGGFSFKLKGRELHIML